MAAATPHLAARRLVVSHRRHVVFRLIATTANHFRPRLAPNCDTADTTTLKGTARLLKEVRSTHAPQRRHKIHQPLPTAATSAPTHAHMAWLDFTSLQVYGTLTHSGNKRGNTSEALADPVTLSLRAGHRQKGNKRGQWIGSASRGRGECARTRGFYKALGKQGGSSRVASLVMARDMADRQAGQVHRHPPSRNGGEVRLRSSNYRVLCDLQEIASWSQALS